MNLEDWCCVSFSSDTKSDQHTTGFRLPTSRSHRATESSPDLQSRYVHRPQVQKLFALYDGLAYYMSYMYTVHIFMYTRHLKHKVSTTNCKKRSAGLVLKFKVARGLMIIKQTTPTPTETSSTYRSLPMIGNIKHARPANGFAWIGGYCVVVGAVQPQGDTINTDTQITQSMCVFSIKTAL